MNANTDQADALKPCPFCGKPGHETDGSVTCGNAMCLVIVSGTVAEWNTRAPEPEGERLNIAERAFKEGYSVARFERHNPQPDFDWKNSLVYRELKKAAPTAQPEAEPTGECPKHGCFTVNLGGESVCPKCDAEPTVGSGEGEASDDLPEWALAHAMACVYQHSGPASVMSEAPEPVAIARHFLKAATSAAEQALRLERDRLKDAQEVAERAEQALREKAASMMTKLVIGWRGNFADLKAKLAAAEQAKAQAEQREKSAIELRDSMARGYEIINDTLGICRECRDQFEAERDAARSEVEQLKRQQAMDAECIERCQHAGAKAEVELAEANTDAAYASEAIETIKGCFPEDHPCRHPETGVSVIGGVSNTLRELAEARDALRAALIPLAALKMGQQTKPYAEHAATLTAEIASAHNAVYAALLKAQEAKA